MKKILVIADRFGSDQCAFHKSIELARLTVADIHVVSFCYESLNSVEGDTNKDDKGFSLKDLVIQYTQKKWDEFIKANKPSQNISHEIVWEKHIHEWVLSHCEKTHYDLIIKTGHRSESLFYTPTDWLLFRESTVPVYCVSAKAHAAKKVVLVALDLRSQRKEKQLLNNALLETAFQLAVQTDSVLHCCYAIKITTLVKDFDLIDVTAKIHQVENEVREQAKSWFDVYDIDKKHLHIKEGEPWQVVNNFARKLKAQCVVVGSMGRKGVYGKVIGNTAEQIIHHAAQDASSDLLVI